MRRTSLAFVAAAALAAPALANMAPPPELIAEREVRDATIAYLENFNAGNVTGMLGMFSDRPGVAILENGRVAYEGKAEMEKALTQAFATMKGVRTEVVGDVQVLATDPSPEAAVATFAFTTFMTDDKGAEAPAFGGVMTLVFAQESAGWRIVSFHSSGAPAQPAGDAPPPAKAD